MGPHCHSETTFPQRNLGIALEEDLAKPRPEQCGDILGGTFLVLLIAKI